MKSLQSALLIDVGSTFTKAFAIGLDDEELLASVSTPSTTKFEICTGIDNAINLINEAVGEKMNFNREERAIAQKVAGDVRYLMSQNERWRLSDLAFELLSHKNMFNFFAGVVWELKGYEPKPEIIHKAELDAKKTNCKIEISNNPLEAVKDADVIYTDVWTSMGFEKEKEIRKNAFLTFQVNQQLVKHAKEDVIILHCLPAHREEEITDEVIDSEKSVVVDQAENRMHAQNAVLSLVM